MAYRVILEQLDSKLRLLGSADWRLVTAYLDDTHLVVDEGNVDSALEIVREVFSEFSGDSGLELNDSKTRVVKPSDFGRTGYSGLGSHMGEGKEGFIEAKVDAWKGLLAKLQTVPNQDAFLLLRSCILPKLNYMLRTVDVDSLCWQEAQNGVSEFLSKITSPLGLNTYDPRLVSLPVRKGGLGLPSPTLVSERAIAASKAASLEAVKSWLSPAMEAPQSVPRPSSTY